MKTKHDEMIKTISLNQEINPKLVQAIVCKESGGDSNAVRFEIGYFDNGVVKSEALTWEKSHKGMPSYQTERAMRATSFGLLQIMGQLAREQGYKGDFLTYLLDPRENILFGITIMKKWLVRLKGNVDHLILAWNRGPGTPAPKGDEQYLVKVQEFIKNSPYEG